MEDKNGVNPEEPVSFSVMPGSGAPINTQKKMSDIIPNNHHHSIWSSRATYIVMGILILVALGAGAYFLLGTNEKEQDAETRLPKVFLKEHFGVEICMDKSICGDDADPDNDGLKNVDELPERTLPTNPDTDGDGLSDGDEVNIFKTSPIKDVTDTRPAAIENRYTDGSQIKNGYDPLTPGLKINPTRQSQIDRSQGEYGLHEPTISTLNKTP